MYYCSLAAFKFFNLFFWIVFRTWIGYSLESYIRIYSDIRICISLYLSCLCLFLFFSCRFMSFVKLGNISATDSSSIVLAPTSFSFPSGDFSDANDRSFALHCWGSLAILNLFFLCCPDWVVSIDLYVHCYLHSALSPSREFFYFIFFIFSFKIFIWFFFSFFYFLDFLYFHLFQECNFLLEHFLWELL